MPPRNTTKPPNWMKKDEKWQARSFYLSSFVRMKIEISTNVYEFIDDLINRGYQAPLDDLNNVDREIKEMYKQYAEQTNWDDRI